MDKVAIIVAGGSGQRMGSSIPKQFLLLQDKPLLCYSIEAFLNVFADMKIVLALPAEHLEKGQEIITAHQYKNVTIVPGGNTRFDSVKNGLATVQGDAIIFVHDAVRSMVSKDLIKRCYEQALKIGSAVPAVAATDSIRLMQNEEHRIVAREDVRIIQTPQTFRSDILLPAFQQEYVSSFTDEATVVEATGQKVFLIEGDHDNLKITRPIDLLVAEKILENRSTSL